MQTTILNLIKSILNEDYESVSTKDTSKLDEVRTALNFMLKEIDKIERGDKTAALRFGYKVENFVNMRPASKLQKYFSDTFER